MSSIFHENFIAFSRILEEQPQGSPFQLPRWNLVPSLLGKCFLGSTVLHRTALHQGRSQGEGGKSPPPKPNKLLWKNGVISEGSIFSNKFYKIKINIKNSIFSITFSSKIAKFSQNFPTICVCRPNAQKINAQFVNLIEKYALNAFLVIF